MRPYQVYFTRYGLATTELGPASTVTEKLSWRITLLGR